MVMELNELLFLQNKQRHTLLNNMSFLTKIEKNEVDLLVEETEQIKKKNIYHI